MKKIKTITCHDVYNTGASLQAYALCKYLGSMGHDAQVIDYKPDYLSNHYSFTLIPNPRFNKPLLREVYLLAKFPGRLKRRFGKRKKAFDSFTREYLPLTAKRYRSNDELKQDIPEADVYFAGSDQIWNTLFPNGKDPAFYLDFAPKGAIKASYAASFATETVADEWKDTLKERISALDFVSVREKSGLNILADLGISGGCQVLDPVFLLGAAHWRSIAKTWNGVPKEPYLLVYDFDGNDAMTEFAKTLAQKHGWKVVSFLKHPVFSENYGEEGPIAFLSLIDNAQAVLSNSFHATAFSLIFGKEFWAFNRKEAINTRMRDMVGSVGLQDRLVCDSTAPETPIDYAAVNARLQEQIEASKEYINRVITEKKA